MFEELIKTLKASPIVSKNGYQYFVHPLTDGVPAMDPKVLGEIIEWMKSIGNFHCDLILAPESMGIPLQYRYRLISGSLTVLSGKTVRAPREIVLRQKTGYSDSIMSINGVEKGDKVVVIDDVLSTGGTVIALIQALQNDIGAEIVDVIIPVNKNNGKDIVKKNTGTEVKTLVDVSIVNEKVECKLC